MIATIITTLFSSISNADGKFILCLERSDLLVAENEEKESDWFSDNVSLFFLYSMREFDELRNKKR